MQLSKLVCKRGAICQLKVCESGPFFDQKLVKG